MTDKNVVVLIGPPGCGKGTQGRLVAQEFGIPELSAGDMLRQEASLPTGLGRRIRTLLDAGELVDDAIMDAALARRLGGRDCANGFVLDGYPRTTAQARTLDSLLARAAMPTPVVLHFEISAAAIIERLSARRLCPVCGRIYNLLHQPPAEPDFCDDDGMILIRRSDDQPEIVVSRIRLYEELTSPLLAFYADRNLHRVDAGRSPAEVYADIRELLTASLVAVS
jgi:adenylate kinase